ncbi:MAG: metallophosphoesterase [Armatimonadota bacterium]
MKTELIPKVFIKRVALVLGVLALIAGICLVDAFYIEPWFPRVITQNIYIDDLPPALDGLKIVHLSDLHIVKVGRREQRALKLIIGIKPDLICLTGDYIEDDGITPGEYTWQDCIPEAVRFMSGLHARYGVYAVMGNWDRQEMIPPMEDAGVRVLDDDPVEVAIGGSKVRLCSERDLQPRSDCGAVIVLDHFSDVADDIKGSGRRADLALAGHWHGGQVGWPLKMTDVKYLAGLYHVGETQLYVTRGLGMHSIPVRFNCPSEISLLVLRTKK